jgi:hypothetical protein
VESGIESGAAQFFLPIGLVEHLEAEVFFLMELQGGTYDSVMAMPFSRRKRFVEQKQNLETSRRSNEEQAASKARMRARTRGRR